MIFVCIPIVTWQIGHVPNRVFFLCFFLFLSRNFILSFAHFPGVLLNITFGMFCDIFFIPFAKNRTIYFLLCFHQIFSLVKFCGRWPREFPHIPRDVSHNYTNGGFKYVAL